jgi:hypothetical protein
MLVLRAKRAAVVAQGHTAHRNESAKIPKRASDDVEISRPGSSAIGSGIKGNIFRMLDADSIAILKIQDKRTKRHLVNQSLNFIAHNFGPHC